LPSFPVNGDTMDEDYFLFPYFHMFSVLNYKLDETLEGIREFYDE